MSKEISCTQTSGVLSEIFSSRAAAQIVDFFIDHKEFDYSPSEIAQKTGLSFRTVFREIPSLERYQLIYKSRKIGKTNMYILNSDNTAIGFLEKFTLEMSEHYNNNNKSLPSLPGEEESPQLYEGSYNNNYDEGREVEDKSVIYTNTYKLNN